MPARRYMGEIGSAAMLASKRLAGVVPEMNLREHATCTPLQSANKGAHSGFQTRGEVTRSPTHGYQWTHKKDLCPQIFLKKIIVNNVNVDDQATGNYRSFDCPTI